MRGTTWLTWLIVVACGVALVLAPACSRVATKEPVVEVEIADFEKTVIVTGHMVAAETLSLHAEAQGKLSFMAPEGSFVKKGDPVFGLETQEMESGLQTAEIDLSIAEAGLGKAVEEVRTETVKSALSLQEAQSQLEFTTLQAEETAADLVKKQRQVENKILPRAELSAAQLAVQRSELDVANARIALDRQREEAASRKQTLALDKESAQARLDKATRQVADSREYIAKSTVAAPRDGVLVHSKNWRGQPWKVGDEVWQGLTVMELPDLSVMDVGIEIHEADIGDVKTGMPARIAIDAYPDMKLTGRVAEIAGVAKEVKDREGNATGVRVFDATIDLDIQDDRLRPGLTARVEIVADVRPGALVVPATAVRREGDASWVELEGGERRDVVVASSSSDVAVISEGLKEGERVKLAPGREQGDEGEAATPASGASAPDAKSSSPGSGSSRGPRGPRGPGGPRRAPGASRGTPSGG